MKQKTRFKNFGNISIGLKKTISVDLYQKPLIRFWWFFFCRDSINTCHHIYQNYHFLKFSGYIFFIYLLNYNEMSQQCMNFWRLCLLGAGTGRIGDPETCSTQYHFRLFKNVDCFMSFHKHYSNKAATLLFHTLKGKSYCLIQTTRIRDLQWWFSIFDWC